MSIKDYSKAITIKRDHNAHVSAYFLNFHKIMMGEAAKTKDRIILGILK